MEPLLKLTQEQYNNLFITSDLHFNHNREFVWKARGFSSVEEMNDKLISIINETVGPKGILLSLGDWCLNTDSTKYIDIWEKLKVGQIWMIAGNHNNPHSKIYGYGSCIGETSHRHDCPPITRYGHYLTFRFSSKFFVCFHFPQLVWDGQSDGSMHLCGHSHGDLQYSRPENLNQKVLDCGIDIHKKPLSMKEVEAIMNTKSISIIHHDKSR